MYERETCLVCGEKEPCSHDFDEFTAGLAVLGGRFGADSQESVYTKPDGSSSPEPRSTTERQ